MCAALNNVKNAAVMSELRISTSCLTSCVGAGSLEAGSRGSFIILECSGGGAQSRTKNQSKLLHKIKRTKNKRHKSTMCRDVKTL